MSKETENISAFPMGYHRDGNSADHFGMTLRDYFAAKALPSAHAYEHHLDEFQSADAVAKRAYEYADAMMKARSTHTT